MTCECGGSRKVKRFTGGSYDHPPSAELVDCPRCLRAEVDAARALGQRMTGELDEQPLFPVPRPEGKQ